MPRKKKLPATAPVKRPRVSKAPPPIPTAPAPLACQFCGANEGLKGQPFTTRQAVVLHERGCPERSAQERKDLMRQLEAERRAKVNALALAEDRLALVEELRPTTPPAGVYVVQEAPLHPNFCPHCGENLTTLRTTASAPREDRAHAAPKTH